MYTTAQSQYTVSTSRFVNGRISGQRIAYSGKHRISTTDSTGGSRLLCSAADTSQRQNYIVQTDDSLIRTAVQYYDSIGDIPMQAKAHYHWGGVLRDQNNYFHALHLYINAANYAKRSEKSKLLSLIYNNIGNIYYQENHYNKADSMYQLLQQQATLQKIQSIWLRPYPNEEV